MPTCLRCKDLEASIALYEARIRDLETELGWFRTHRTLARGIAGEVLVVAATGGVATPHTAAVDIVLPSGAKIEVKSAGLARDCRTGGTKWQWGKIFGERNAKAFDFLLLIGAADKRYADRYAFPGERVLFLVPKADLGDMTAQHTAGARGMSITTDPARARGRAARLYTDYQVSADDLSRLVVAEQATA